MEASISASYNYGSGGSGYCRVNSSGILAVQPRFNGAGGTELNSLASICDNVWHFIVITRSGSTLKLFVDGVLQESASDYQSAGNTTLHSITTGANLSFIGAEFGWNQTMTDQQVADWYAAR
jgi:hypothetical protein